MDLDLLSSNEEEEDSSLVEDNEIDEESHNNLLNVISSLDNKRRNSIKQRTESSVKVDEFNLTEAANSKISFGDLITSLRKSGSHVKLKKQLRTTSKQKIILPPLSKPEAERAQRAVAYDKASVDVDKWNNVVQKNRLADQIIYPLKRSDLSLQPIEEVTKRFKHGTPLELEISELLQGSKNVTSQEKELTAAEEEALKAMSLDEAIKRRNELRKMRALQSYQEAKARRQNKIKSKKFHRLMKKDKLKKKMKEFEELQKVNPELALEKLEEMDKSRIGERMSLKHRNTGKWAKHNMIRAKYDTEAREALKEQIQINKKLTEKREVVSNSEDEAETELLIDMDNKNDSYRQIHQPDSAKNDVNSSNPWMKSSVTTSNASKKLHKRQERNIITANDDELHSDSDNELISETLTRKKTLEEYSEENDNTLETELSSKPATHSKIKTVDNAKMNGKVEVDPTNFITLQAKELKSQAPDLSGVGDEVLDKEEVDDQYMTIAEAFADDDVIEEFKADKEATVKKDTPQDIDLTLPGWGSWGGAGIKVSSRKRKRFTIKTNPGPPRKDHTLGNVIINEKESQSLAKHQVSELPHPFTSVQQFQNSVRMPIGRTWNPETAFVEITKPKVVTKLGAIIKPMDADSLLKSNKSTAKKTSGVKKSQKSNKRSNKRNKTR